MANGAKFSQIGVDISRASDHELHFNSEWPTVHILQGGKVTTTVMGGGVGSIFYEHGLGFTPAFLPYTYDSITGEFEIFRAIMTIDKRYIRWYAPGGGGGGAGDVTYGIMIFNIDLESPYTAPSINPNPQTVGGDGVEVGMKFAIEGEDVKSKDMQNFKANTGARAPLIHAVAHGKGTIPGTTSVLRDFEYTHNLPYNPMFIPYIEWDGADSRGEYLIVANFAGTITEGNKITLKDIKVDYNASIVFFKDPFDVSENTTVVNI
jgi:hypothetical protein